MVRKGSSVRVRQRALGRGRGARFPREAGNRWDRTKACRRSEAGLGDLGASGPASRYVSEALAVMVIPLSPAEQLTSLLGWVSTSRSTAAVPLGFRSM